MVGVGVGQLNILLQTYGKEFQLVIPFPIFKRPVLFSYPNSPIDKTGFNTVHSDAV